METISIIMNSLLMRNVLCKYGRIAWNYMDVENMKNALRYLGFTFLLTNFLHFNFNN